VRRSRVLRLVHLCPFRDLGLHARRRLGRASALPFALDDPPRFAGSYSLRRASPLRLQLRRSLLASHPLPYVAGWEELAWSTQGAELAWSWQASETALQLACSAMVEEARRDCWLSAGRSSVLQVLVLMLTLALARSQQPL